MSDRPRLDSWKEIARHLGRDVRTVIRWERHRGLPVYRVPGGRVPRVFAYPDELDRWLANRIGPEPPGDEPLVEPTPALPTPPVPPPASPAPLRAVWLTGAVAAAVLGTAALWGWGRAAGPVATLAIARNELIAFDAAANRVWAHLFDAADFGPPLGRWNWLGDLDADSHDDALAAVQIRGPGAKDFFVELSRFSARGAREWSRTVDDRITFGQGAFGPPWVAADLSTYRVNGERRIAWAVHHFTWWPGLLVTLDAQGNRLGTFVNAGWIRGVDPSPDERHLLLSGVTNSRESYFFGVLDAERPTGRSPEPADAQTSCLDCPRGDPLQYVVFPRTDISRHQPFPAPGPTLVTRADGTIEAHVLSSDGPNIADTIYEFSPLSGAGATAPYQLRAVAFSDSHWEWHRRLEQDGRIDHPAAECPHRRSLELQQWTPDRGWASIRIAVD